MKKKEREEDNRVEGKSEVKTGRGRGRGRCRGACPEVTSRKKPALQVSPEDHSPDPNNNF